MERTRKRKLKIGAGLLRSGVKVKKAYSFAWGGKKRKRRTPTEAYNEVWK